MASELQTQKFLTVCYLMIMVGVAKRFGSWGVWREILPRSHSTLRDIRKSDSFQVQSQQVAPMNLDSPVNADWFLTLKLEVLCWVTLLEEREGI